MSVCYIVLYWYLLFLIKYKNEDKIGRENIWFISHKKIRWNKKYNLIFIFRVENIPDEEEEREKRSSVGQKQHLDFWPTVPTVPSFSSEIIPDLFATINCFSPLRVHPSQMGPAAVVPPPASSHLLSTIDIAPSILVSVPGQRWGMISVCFYF